MIITQVFQFIKTLRFGLEPILQHFVTKLKVLSKVIVITWPLSLLLLVR